MNIRIHKLLSYPYCPFTSFRSKAGFTLVELLAALSLLSIVTAMVFSFYLFTNQQVLKREKKFFAFERNISLGHSLENNIRKSRATLYLDETKWQFIRSNGDTGVYSFQDGILSYNNIPVSQTDSLLISFSFTCFGNDSLLDINNDHEVDFGEMDLNSDKKIEEEETQYIRRIRVTLNFTADPLYAFYTEESVKNRF
jgi:prepilin-type N-terminal cleavage/methylation domain-containing protein